MQQTPLTAEGPMAAPSLDPEAPKPERPRRRRFRGVGLLRMLLLLVAVVAVGGAVAAFGLYRSLESGLPDYRWLADYQPQQMSRIYAADSQLMAELANERRVFVPIEAIPARLQQAFISAEDQRFRDHLGLDPMGMARAALAYAQTYGSGRRLQGASTITQQVAKNMLVGSDRTVLRKAREALLAVRLERALSKERILEIYLNEIFLGAQAYGVAAAAQSYFNHSLDELTLAETAFLAALPKAPNNYNPQRFPEQARIRRNWVLDRMVEDGAITPAEAEAAKRDPVQARPTRRPDVLPVGQHFTEDVRRELITRFGAEQAAGGGLVVRTSLDPQLQAAAENALRQGTLAYDRRRGGWRGSLGRIPFTPDAWQASLEAMARTPGILPNWRQAVVQSITATEARVAWLERPNPRAPAEPRTAIIDLSDTQWARPVLPAPAQAAFRLGAAPRRMADIVTPGEVVLVEPNNRPGRVSLRQIPDVEAAVVALDPATGRILAMAGGWNFERSQFNRASQAQRQPGSSFKPFVYLAALEEGVPPNQRFSDSPVEVPMGNGQMWRPGNYGGSASGAAVTMRSALERSLNLVTVRIAQQVTMARVSDTANRFGVTTAMPPFLAMSLGAGETTVVRMAAAYAGFVNGGRRVEPSLIDSVQDQRGRVIWRGDQRVCVGCTAGPTSEPPTLTENRRQIADPIAAYQIVNILQGAVQRGTGTRAGAGLNRPVAGKTGTTDDYKDNWFVGFTPDIVVAVWFGHDEPRSLGSGETGGLNAAPIFRDVMEAALRGSPPVPFRAPPGVSLVRVQLDNGQSIMEAFRPGTETSATWGAGGGSAERVESNLGGVY